jgi:hypothetical protein
VQSGDEHIVIELKNSQHPHSVLAVVRHLEQLMAIGKFSGGVALTASSTAKDYEMVEPIRGDNRIKLISPLTLKTGK